MTTSRPQAPILAVAVSILLPLAVACGTSPAPRDAPAPGDSSELWDVVDAAWRWHIHSAKRKDLEAVLEIYAADIVYVTPGGPEVRGIDAVREMEAQALATADVVDAVHETRSLHVFGDVAYEIGTVVGPIKVDDTPPRIVRYHFMAMWQPGADGGWRIRHIVGQAPPDTDP